MKYLIIAALVSIVFVLVYFTRASLPQAHSESRRISLTSLLIVSAHDSVAARERLRKTSWFVVRGVERGSRLIVR